MAETLPPTGSDSFSPLYFGIVVVALGSLAVVVTARRRASRT
jgi:LPXTG-motif cell wall-anchored protein